MSRPTPHPAVREMLRALVSDATASGVLTQHQARLALAKAWGVSELSVREWSRGRVPLPDRVARIVRAYRRIARSVPVTGEPKE